MERKEANYKEQFSRLSPKERNNIFRQMWFSLPFNVYRDTRKFTEDLEDGDPLFKIATKTEFDPEKEIKQHFKEINKTVENREKSEVRKIQFKKMQALLEFTHVTQSFKEYILKEFNESYIHGPINTQDDPYNENTIDKTFSILWVVEVNKPDSEGIFSKDNAKRLDSKGYRQKLNRHFWLERLLEMGIDKGIYTKEQFESWRKQRLETDDIKLLKQWRKEHLELFNNEP